MSPLDRMALEECQGLCEASPVPLPSGLIPDPVEDDPRFARVFTGIDVEVAAHLADYPRRGELGFVSIVWETKERLLKEKYCID